MKKAIFLLLLAVLGSSSMRASELTALETNIPLLADIPNDIIDEIDTLAEEAPSISFQPLSFKEHLRIDPSEAIVQNPLGTGGVEMAFTAIFAGVAKLRQIFCRDENSFYVPDERDYLLMHRLELKGSLFGTKYTNNLAFLQSDNDLSTYDDLHIINIENEHNPKLLDTITINPQDRFYVIQENDKTKLIIRDKSKKVKKRYVINQHQPMKRVGPLKNAGREFAARKVRKRKQVLFGAWAAGAACVLAKIAQSWLS